MRRLLSFTCETSLLGASLDTADGATGILIVTGGTQTRIGSHRLFERLAHALASSGHSCFRFDRRGIGDSEGEDPGFRGNGADIAAATAVFRSQCPQIRRVIGLGLCDGATSLALFGHQGGIDGLVMINPWLVEAESGVPSPAAIRHHYRKRLLSIEGWKKILTGAVSYRKLFSGVAKTLRPTEPADLANDVAMGLALADVPVELVLARDDATAVAAADVWQSGPFRRAIGSLPIGTSHIESDAHTFSRPGDFQSLLEVCRAAIGRLEGSGGR